MAFGQPNPDLAYYGRHVAEHLGPRAARFDSDRIQLFYRVGFLSPEECDGMIAVIDAGRRPSSLFKEDTREDYRTSESCDLNPRMPLVRTIEQRIAATLGMPPAFSETMQGQRYAPGQKFAQHHDFFPENSGYWKRVTEVGGQRSWTAMIYLNDVAAGGQTRFPRLGIEIAPRRGLLLTWNNMGPDGSPNIDTLHEGRPVEDGVKYIVTKWFRARDYSTRQ